jgi:hypothetical protein
VVHETGVIAVAEILDGGPSRRGRGRPPGARNKITRDIRAALRDLAEGNADRVQSWLDPVAEKEPAEALRLWTALLRYVTPTLQAAAIADVTRTKSRRELLAQMSSDELDAIILFSPEAARLIQSGTVKDLDDLRERIIAGERSAEPLLASPSPTDEDLLR